MIIHNNNLGLTVYTKHSKENYDRLYKEYCLHQDERDFWSETEKKVISSAWCCYITDKVYKRFYFRGKVMDLGVYSLVIKGLNPAVIIRLNIKYIFSDTTVMGVVIDENLLMLAKEHLLVDDMLILYFDDQVTCKVSDEITLCFITK